jgi:hypothetical protein
MLETKFGPMAQDGDYVVVVDFNYMKRSCNTYVARVYRDKAYTGIKIPGTNKYVHKLRAEAIIPEEYVPEEVKQKINEDIVMHAGLNIECDVRRGILWER